MSKPSIQVISERKLQLQNPYAFIEEIAAHDDLHAARKKLECPYAYEEELDLLTHDASTITGIDLGPTPKPLQKRTPKSDLEIQQFAREMQIQIWKNRATLFPNFMSMQPIDMLDPIVALKIQGYGVEIAHAVGMSAYSDKHLSNIAGLIDESKKHVLLSSGFSPDTRNFTAAHELGHAMMHEFSGMHRDRPLDGSASNSDPQEREADRFAGYFLMPEKLLLRIFQETFGLSPFVINDDTRFALSGQFPGSSDSWTPRSLRDLSRVLSSASRFNGFNITPLMNQFRVSREAMAIRLEQLALVALVQR